MYYNEQKTKENLELALKTYAADSEIFYELAAIPQSEWHNVLFTSTGRAISDKLFASRFKGLLRKYGMYLFVDSTLYRITYKYNSVSLPFDKFVRLLPAYQSKEENFDFEALRNYFLQNAEYYKKEAESSNHVLSNIQIYEKQLKEQLDKLEEYNKTAPSGFKIHINYVY